MMRKSMLAQTVALGVLTTTTAAQAQPMYTQGNRPVMLQADEDDLDPCVYGVIYDEEATGPFGGGAILVFPGDSTDLEQVDTLVHGDNVWICEASDDFFGIVYPVTPGQDCELSSPEPFDRPYLGPCNWGWVKAQWVEVIAG
jgi:hypothetical protein